jgi:type IV pilus assembly protein PilM
VAKAKEIVGLKLGASSLAAAVVSTNGAVELVQTAKEPLARGIFAGGEVRDVVGLTQALKEFFRKHKLPKKAVRVGIANNRIGVRTVELTGITDAKQITNAVRFRAQEVLPIPLEEAVLDYQVLADSQDEDGHPSKRVLLVVAYRDLVDSIAAACQQAGVRLVGIDLEAFALVRALAAHQAAQPADGTERGALVAVSIGSERSTLAVSDGYTCDFTRVLDWGGAVLTTALARQLELEVDEAERVKLALSLDGDDVPPGLDAERAQKAREAVRLGLQGFARELVSSLQFYQSQQDSLGIREVILAGGASQLNGLAASLQRLIGVTVQAGDPTAGVVVAKRVGTAALDPSLAIPIGLGMGI